MTNNQSESVNMGVYVYTLENMDEAKVWALVADRKVAGSVGAGVEVDSGVLRVRHTSPRNVLHGRSLSRALAGGMADVHSC